MAARDLLALENLKHLSHGSLLFRGLICIYGVMNDGAI